MRSHGRITAALATIFFASTAANASVTVNIVQSGADVVGTASGTLSLTGLTNVGSFGASPGVSGSSGFVSFFSTGSSGTGFTGFTGPASWGSGDFVSTAMSPGASPFGFNASAFSVPYVFVADNFVSGSAVTGTGSWTGTTLAALGLNQGTYVYRSVDDTITVNIGGAVPEPSTWAMMIGGFGAIGGVMRRRRRAARVSFA